MRASTFGGAVAAAIAIGVGCSGQEAATPNSKPPGMITMAGPSGPTGPTFYKDVVPILQKVCQDCHVPGGIGPFPLVTYEDAKANAADIVKQTGSRIMPPWGAQTPTAECAPRFPYANDIRLSDKEISTLGDWLENGLLEGNKADAPPAPPAHVTGLPGVQQEITPQAPYTLQGPQDQFICFVLDPKITKTVYLNGSNVVPGNPQVVHHALIYADKKGESRSKADPTTGSYPCFGGPGISSPQLLTPWAPGEVPQEYPSNVGVYLDPGTLLVMQVHYHPQSAAAAAPDLTKYQMRFIPSPPQYQVLMLLVGNFTNPVGANGIGLVPSQWDTDPAHPQFLIPANTDGHTITQLATLPTTVNFGGATVPMPTGYIGGVGAHMHWVGTDEKITIHRANPTATQPADECLLQEPRWDFYWQRGYNYDVDIDKLPTLSGGDSVTMRCTYNNTMSNPRLATSLMQQGLTSPHDVHLGETTLDEMCLGVFGILYDLPFELPPL